jgi:cell division protein FtsZ
LESLIDLIYNPGVINIDFADLRTILRGRGNSAFLNTVEDSGKDRVAKICENIFKNPLLQNNGFKAEKILFNIEGSENLSMFEVEKISSHISGLNPKAKIIFGISKNPKLKNRIKTTILMTGGQAGEAPVLAPVIIPVKKVIEPAVLKVEDKPKLAEEKKISASAKVSADKKKPVKKQKKAIKEKKKKPVSAEKKEPSSVAGEKLPSSLPVFEVPLPSARTSDAVLDKKLAGISQATVLEAKKTIRRSGLEIKKAEELQEKKRIAQEKEWEIPAFLRKLKIKS